MRFPHVIPAHNLAHEWPATCTADGFWTPARPEPHTMFEPWWRIKIAWYVFIGKYDALRWHDQ